MAVINSGLFMHLLPRTAYSLTGLANGASTTIPLAQHIDVSVFTQADLLVRVHTAQMVAGSTVRVDVFSDGFTFEDPALAYPTTAPIFSVPIPPATVGPVLLVGSTNTSPPSNMGRLLTVTLFFQQPAGAGALNVTLSLDLALKGGDPSSMDLAPNCYRGYRGQ